MISFSRPKSKPAGPDVTPLLDVVFILLIFFVVSSMFAAKGVDMELPSAETAKTVSGKSMEIRLDEDGMIFCDTEPMTLAELDGTLRTTAARPLAKQPRHILLKAAPRARVERFMRIVDAVRKHGFGNLVIATNTSPPDDGPAEQAP